MRKSYGPEIRKRKQNEGQTIISVGCKTTISAAGRERVWKRLEADELGIITFSKRPWLWCKSPEECAANHADLAVLTCAREECGKPLDRLSSNNRSRVKDSPRLPCTVRPWIHSRLERVREGRAGAEDDPREGERSSSNASSSYVYGKAQNQVQNSQEVGSHGDRPNHQSESYVLSSDKLWSRARGDRRRRGDKHSDARLRDVSEWKMGGSMLRQRASEGHGISRSELLKPETRLAGITYQVNGIKNMSSSLNKNNGVRECRAS